MTYFLYLLLAVLFFGILIAVHEFGHFATAKACKIKVNEFAIGMGPLIFQRKRGETLYSLRAFPIGGFCAMEGEDEETGDPHAFSIQPAWKKLLVLGAGAAMNFLFGLLLAFVLMSQVSVFTTPVLTGFMDGFPLEGESGLMVGDEILKIDGKRVYLFDDVSLLLNRAEGPVDLLVRRGGEEITLRDLPLELKEYEHEGEKVLRYGLVFRQKEANFPERLRLGFNQTLYFVRLVWVSLGDLVSGNVGLRDMSGVVGIVDAIGSAGAQSETVGAGILNVIYFVAFIAVNLAVMNLLPLPALDGGRIFFVLVNGLCYTVTRKQIPARYEGYVHTAGLILLLGLMLAVTISDVWKLFG